MARKKKPLSYSDLLKRLEIPEGTRITRKCSFCGQDMHMVKVNKYVAFMVHRPEQQDKCATANPQGIPVPLIFNNKDYLLKKLDQYYLEITGVDPSTIDSSHQPLR